MFTEAELESVKDLLKRRRSRKVFERKRLGPDLAVRLINRSNLPVVKMHERASTYFSILFAGAYHAYFHLRHFACPPSQLANQEWVPYQLRPERGCDPSGVQCTFILLDYMYRTKNPVTIHQILVLLRSLVSDEEVRARVINNLVRLLTYNCEGNVACYLSDDEYPNPLAFAYCTLEMRVQFDKVPSITRLLQTSY